MIVRSVKDRPTRLVWLGYGRYVSEGVLQNQAHITSGQIHVASVRPEDIAVDAFIIFLRWTHFYDSTFDYCNPTCMTRVVRPPCLHMMR